MLTVAESYFESDDFRGDVILHAAFPHPLLKCLIRFERGPDSLMRTDDRSDALSRYFEPRVYQRNRAHLCLPGPVVSRQTVSDWFAGRTVATLSTGLKIQAFLQRERRRRK